MLNISVRPLTAAALAALAAALLAACAGSEPGGDCTTVYTLGEAEAAQLIARGQHVSKPGPVAAQSVPKNAPRAFLEPDGSYAGGRVFCSAADARAFQATLVQKGLVPKDRPWRVYEVDASWTKDVYEKHPGDYRLKHPARMTKLAN